MKELYNPHPPLDQLNQYALNLHPRSISKSELRGEICGFIGERKEVTHQELLDWWEELRKNFVTHELELDEALTGLFDRQYLDYRQGPNGGTYFLNPDPPGEATSCGQGTIEWFAEVPQAQASGRPQRPRTAFPFLPQAVPRSDAV